MKPEEAIPLLQRGLVGEIYDQKGFLTALGYEALDAIDSSNCKTLVQKQHGEWIYHKEWEWDGECAFECSKCGMGADIDYNYCPRCGADMRKEGEAE